MLFSVDKIPQLSLTPNQGIDPAVYLFDHATLVQSFAGSVSESIFDHGPWGRVTSRTPGQQLASFFITYAMDLALDATKTIRETIEKNSHEKFISVSLVRCADWVIRSLDLGYTCPGLLRTQRNVLLSASASSIRINEDPVYFLGEFGNNSLQELAKKDIFLNMAVLAMKMLIVRNEELAKQSGVSLSIPN